MVPTPEIQHNAKTCIRVSSIVHHYMSSIFEFMFHHYKVSTKCKILNLTMTLRLTAEVETGLIPEIFSMKHQRKNVECIRRQYKTHIYDLLRIRQLSNNFVCALVLVIKSQPSFREPGSVKWRHSVGSSDVSSQSNFYRKATTLIVRQDIF